MFKKTSLDRTLLTFVTFVQDNRPKSTCNRINHEKNCIYAYLRIDLYL